MSMAAMTPAASPCHSSPMARPQVDLHRSRSSRAPARTTIVAPGAGTGINAAVYERLQAENGDFQVSVVGQSRAPYDCYPSSWSHGGPPPNLESFAIGDVLRWVDSTDCFIFGSRGGQVVLPTLWRERGSAVPPAVVINGGCAMNLPELALWPESAITFLLIGGQDNFRGNLSEEAYIAETKRHVPRSSGSTAILFVDEMTHMPQARLLQAILPHMLRTILAWKAVQNRQGDRRRVKEQMRHILAALNRDGWSGHLMYTEAEGVWEDIAFSPYIVNRCPMANFAIPEEDMYEGSPIEYTRRDELRDLIRTAAVNSRPDWRPGCDMHQPPQPGARFAAVAHAAVHCQEAAGYTGQTPASPAARARTGRPFLPIPMAGEAGPQALPLPRTGYAGVSPNADATPISRALGLRARRLDASPAGSYTHSPSYAMVSPIH